VPINNNNNVAAGPTTALNATRQHHNYCSTYHHAAATTRPSRSNSIVEEYGSMNVVVVENDDNEPRVVHDFVGPVLNDGVCGCCGDDDKFVVNLQRTDSIISSIWSAIDAGERYQVDYGGCGDGDGNDPMLRLPDHPAEDYGGQASIPSEIASMTKNIVGCGALSLCNGIALCGDSPYALIAANFWILVLGAIFGYFCFLIAKLCDMTGRQTYRGLWQDTYGYKGSMAVSIANVLKAVLADLAYASILTDTLSSLFEAVNRWDIEIPRTACLLLVTVFGILPLCLLKNLHVLAPFSVVGTSGIAFTAMSMMIRYFDGSYLPEGQYYNDIQPQYRPSFGNTNRSWTHAVLPFVCK